MSHESVSEGVTVIIPTLNRGGFLTNTLRDLIAQDYSPLEILVVDQSSHVDPEVAHLVEAHGDLIRYERVSFRGLPQSRNYGLRNARYSAVVFVDDDIRCGPNFVSSHLKALRSDPKIGMVAGGIDIPGAPPDLGMPIGKYSRWTATSRSREGFSNIGTAIVDRGRGANFSVWKDIALAVGGFDERLAVGTAMYEDTEFALRMGANGYVILFDGKARLDHLVAPTGGCRLEYPPSRYYALNHNRSILIRRYSRWYQWPVAFAVTAKSIAGAMVRNRSLAAGRLATKGAIDGWRNGAKNQ